MKVIIARMTGKGIMLMKHGEGLCRIRKGQGLVDGGRQTHRHFLARMQPEGVNRIHNHGRTGGRVGPSRWGGVLVSKYLVDLKTIRHSKPIH